jgi:hypothetical protein
MRALVVAASLLVPVPACALETGSRLPTRYGEVIVVKNDGRQKLDHLFSVWLDLSHRS